MPDCLYCREPVLAQADQCPHCLRFFDDQLIARTRHPDATVREQAVKNMVFVDRTESAAEALATALTDRVPSIRLAAAVVLFTFGQMAEPATPTLIAALDDDDNRVRGAAAAALANLGLHARAALPKLQELQQLADKKLRVWVDHALKSIGTEPFDT